MHATGTHTNQSILVSGESGAGKTECVKIVTRYLALVGGNDSSSECLSDIANAVVQANPILEAFGNAKTLRNDNSSRFGKFTQILFGSSGAIVGSRVDTYLLEKTRVIGQSKGERNYHVFYQLLASLDDIDDAETFCLRPASEYSILTESGLSTTENDRDGFLEMRNSMKAIGLLVEQQTSLFRTLSSVLEISNIAIEAGGLSESGEIKAALAGGEDALGVCAKLISCAAKDLEELMLTRRICARDEWYTISLTPAEAQASRNTLAKSLYGKMFDWLVRFINTSTKPLADNDSSIGVLDIFGFESFEHNSFEQLLINFANEKLQQQFTLVLFKLEQEEYTREKIDWDNIQFRDNAPILELIEGRGGILDSLDEECKLQRGSDTQLLAKLQQKSKRYPKVSTELGEKPQETLWFPRLGKSKSDDHLPFFVRHFAGTVQYDAMGWREKNKNALHPDMLELMHSSSDEFVKELFPATAPTKKKQKTIGAQFKYSLKTLVDGINSTKVHYVRCLKPNAVKSTTQFDHVSISGQLRCQGILEAIRISRAAFPNRVSHDDFLQRFTMCTETDLPADETNAGNVTFLLSQLSVESASYQVGVTKIFFRRQVLETLEMIRARMVNAECIKIQRAARGWIARRNLRRLQAASICIQKHVRSMAAKITVCTIKSAIVVQTLLRGRADRQDFLRRRSAAVEIQRYARRRLACQHANDLRRDKAVVFIQAKARANLCHGQYRSLRSAVVVMQTEARRCINRRAYIVLRDESREDALLENQVASLQARLAVETNQRAQADHRCQELELELQQQQSEFTAAAKIHNSLSLRTTDCGQDDENPLQELQAELATVREALKLSQKETLAAKAEAEEAQVKHNRLHICLDGMHA